MGTPTRELLAAGVTHAGAMDYVVGPVIATVVLALLALFTRWAFGPPRRRPPSDDGLLVPVATLSRHDLAVALHRALADAGIRSAVRDRGPQRAAVLVFPEDAGRARAVAATFTVPE